MVPPCFMHKSAQSSSDVVKVKVKIKADVRHRGEPLVLLQPIPLEVGAQGGGSGSSLCPPTPWKSKDPSPTFRLLGSDPLFLAL